MQLARPNRLRTALVLTSLAAFLVSQTGCVGMVAHLLNAGFGNRVKAKYQGLVGKRVAVVCVSQSSQFGPTSAAEDVGRSVEVYLRQRVEEIQLVDRQTVSDWMDRNDWNQIDYRELGTGVGCDMLVAVEINSFSLYEGRTLFKGQAEVEMSVYDITHDGRLVYESKLPTIQYPVTGGRHTADTTENDFRREFVDTVSYQIARHFFAYDSIEDYGRDPSYIGF